MSDLVSQDGKLVVDALANWQPAFPSPPHKSTTV